MMIHYLKGDATRPVGEGNRIIVHVSNDVGGWGKGFVLAISKRWKAPEREFRAWYASKAGFELGAVQFVEVEEGLWVANLVGQHGLLADEEGLPPVRYAAIAEGLKKVAGFALERQASVHMPRIGCGLAGGTWDKVEPMIETALVKAGIEVTVYDFN